MIRRASQDDLPRAFELASEFHRYGVWSHKPIDDEAVSNFLVHLIDQGAILIGDTGMIGGLICPLWFSPTVKLAVELFWWAPTEGGELRKAFEQWSAEEGASAIQFSAMSDQHLSGVTRLYRMGGYRPIEVGFIKEIA